MTDHEMPPEDVDEADWNEQHHSDADRSQPAPSAEEAPADTRPSSEVQEDIDVSDDDWPRTDE